MAALTLQFTAQPTLHKTQTKPKVNNMSDTNPPTQPIPAHLVKDPRPQFGWPNPYWHPPQYNAAYDKPVHTTPVYSAPIYAPPSRLQPAAQPQLQQQPIQQQQQPVRQSAQPQQPTARFTSAQTSAAIDYTRARITAHERYRVVVEDMAWYLNCFVAVICMLFMFIVNPVFPIAVAIAGIGLNCASILTAAKRCDKNLAHDKQYLTTLYAYQAEQAEQMTQASKQIKKNRERNEL